MLWYSSFGIDDTKINFNLEAFKLNLELQTDQW